MTGFKDFVTRGNVLDLAVAVIIGAAFSTIVASLTEDVIMPVVGAIFGGLDFSNYFVRLGPLPDSYSGPMSYEALKAAGVPMLGYGQFITTIVNFLILAFIIYQLVKVSTRLREPAADTTPTASDELLVLREIRNELRRQG